MPTTSKLTKDQPKVTVEYPEDVQGPVTVTVTGGDGEPFKKKLTFSDGSGDGGDQGGGDGGDQGGDQGGGEQPDQGDIQVEAKQDEANPRKVTLTLVKAPGDSTGGGSESGSGEPSNGEAGSEGGTQGGSGSTPQSRAADTNPGSGDSGSGSGSGGSGELNIDWGGEVNPDAPKTLTKDKPAEATYVASVTKATVTVDDDDEKTEAWTKQFKFGEAGQEAIKADVQQDTTDPRKVTVKVTEWPTGVDKLTVDPGGKATTGDSASGGEQDSGSQQNGGQAA